MGEVWEAEDTRLGRRVAIKVLPAELAEHPERLERFRREAESLAALDHPNIVALHDIQEVDGLHFLVMSLAEGQTLEQAIPAGGLPVDRFFAIGESLADALACAHDKGITHRDLKPGNVMVGADGRVKVLDFGLAKLQDTAGVTTDTQLPTRALTTDGQILGTFPYMSPEQVEGRDVDRRTDLFSLGVVLYEMATGERPFQGDTPAGLASSILRDAPPRLESRRADLPRHLGRLVQHCLEKDPRGRFQSARDVCNQLRILRKELELSEASGEMPPTAPVTAKPPRSRARWLAPLAAALVAGVVAWAIASRDVEPPSTAMPSAASPDPRKIVAVLPFENLGRPDQAYFAAGMTEEITSRLAGVSGLGVLSRTSVERYERDGKTLPEIGTELGVDFVLEGTVRWAGSSDGASRVRITPQLIRVSDDTHVWSDIYERRLEDVFAVQSEIAQSVLDELGVLLLASDDVSGLGRETGDVEAYDDYLRGSEYLRQAQELNSEENYELAIGMYERAVERDPDFALAWAKLGQAHALMYQRAIDRRQMRLTQARGAAERAMVLAPELPEAHVALGNCFLGLLDTGRALEELEKAVEGRPLDAEIHRVIAQIHMSSGNLDAALVSLAKARALDKRRGELYCQTGGVFRMKGMMAEAVKWHREAIERRPDRGCPYFCLALVYLDPRRGTQQARDFLESLPSTVSRDGYPPINYPWVLADMADGRFEDALERLNEGESEVFEFDYLYKPKALLRARILELMGESEQAAGEWRSAADLVEPRLARRPEDSRLWSALGIAYAGLGRYEEAIRHGLRATELMPIEKDHYAAPYRLKDLAQIYVMAGRQAAALRTLKQIVSEASMIDPAELVIDPIWDPLRDQPAYRELFENLDLAQGAGHDQPVARRHSEDLRRSS